MKGRMALTQTKRRTADQPQNNSLFFSEFSLNIFLLEDTVNLSVMAIGYFSFGEVVRMGFKAFLKWYANYILQFLRQIPFDAKITLATFLGLLIVVFLLSLLHFDALIGMGSVIGTLLAVTVTEYRIAIRGRQVQHKQPQNQ
jgi:hypothetical protein